MERSINYNGFEFSVKYDVYERDDSVGFKGGVEITNVYFLGIDIYEIIDNKILKNLKYEISNNR